MSERPSLCKKQNRQRIYMCDSLSSKALTLSPLPSHNSFQEKIKHHHLQHLSEYLVWRSVHHGHFCSLFNLKDHSEWLKIEPREEAKGQMEFTFPIQPQYPGTVPASPCKSCFCFSEKYQSLWVFFSFF